MSYTDANASDIKRQVMMTYDGISEDFDRTRRKPWPAVADFISGLTKGAPVLDIGCGNGKNAMAVLRHGCPCVCIDLAINQCQVTKAKLLTASFDGSPGFEVLQADCERLPFKDATFDAVLFIATLHHLPGKDHRLAALAEMARCMRPGANGLISVWDFAQGRFEKEYSRQASGGRPLGPGNEFGDVNVSWKTSSRTYPRFYHLFTFEEFRSLVQEAGFSSAAFLTESGNHYARVVR